MDFFCKMCDRSIIESYSEYYEYLTTLRKKDDKILCKKYTINNIKLDEVNKILIDYISIDNKYFDFHFINCEFVIQFDKKIIANINNNSFYNTDNININRFLSYVIDCFKPTADCI